jgi:hypothetical protein
MLSLCKSIPDFLSCASAFAMSSSDALGINRRNFASKDSSLLNIAIVPNSPNRSTLRMCLFQPSVL